MDGREAAEDYRRQLQRAAAEASGFESITREDFLGWLDAKRPFLRELVIMSGGSESQADVMVQMYLDYVKSAPELGEFDDIGSFFILKRLIEEVEQACRAADISIGDGVAFGTRPELNPEASQLPVMETDASIISVNAPFLPLCNLTSKLLALTVETRNDRGNLKIILDPEVVAQRLRGSPQLVERWTQLLASYAIRGWPPEFEALSLQAGAAIARVLFLRAIEVFAVAHEYGHHVLRHGRVLGTDVVEDRVGQEREADTFARAVSMYLALQDEVPNLYMASGAGGVLILGVLVLIRRCRAILETGTEVVEPTGTHPPFDERIAVIAAADELAPNDVREGFADCRTSVAAILETVWAEVSPAIYELHRKGIRPMSGDVDVGGWLPLYR
jgi:hypothetical protein